MYILNVTLNIDNSILQEGIAWVKQEFIPKMMCTDKFTEVLFTRVRAGEQPGGATFAIHFKTKNKAYLKAYYLENDAQIFSEFKNFGEKIVFFRTELEVLDHQ